MVTAGEIAGLAVGAGALGSIYASEAIARHKPSARGARLGGASDTRMLRKQTGIPLGFVRGHQLRAEPNASCVLCGPTQSGKTLSCVVRAIREHDGPLIVLSIKDDVLRHTITGREERGDVKIFDPTGETEYPSQSWSPVYASDTFEHAGVMAGALVEIRTSRRDSEPHWRESATRYLAPLLLAAHESDAPMRTVLQWVHRCDKSDKETLRDILGSSPVEGADTMLEVLESEWKMPPNYRGSVLGTLATALRAWETPRVAQASSGPDITPDWLCFGENTVYIVAPGRQQQTFRNLFGGLITYLIDGALELAQSSGTGRLERTLLCVLDEVCNAAPLPSLHEYASAGAGQGVLLLSVIQDYAQAIDTWGRERAATIFANHRAKLFWAGTDEPETLRYIERMVGQKEILRESRTRQRDGSWTRTEAAEHRPLISPHELRQAKGQRALLVYGRLPPLWVTERFAV